MSETWTEYAVRYDENGFIEHQCGGQRADAILRMMNLRSWGVTETSLMGRTVTASDWLPVNTDDAL